MMEIIQEIQNKIDNENRDPLTLYNEIKNYGLLMFTTNKMTKDLVVAVCADLVKLYEQLKSQG